MRTWHNRRPILSNLCLILIYVFNQSGYESLNLEKGSFVKSDNFDATDLRTYYTCTKVKFKLNPLVLLRNSAKRNGKRVHQDMQHCWKHSHSPSYRFVRPSYLHPRDRGNYKESVACPIVKASNTCSSHFHIVELPFLCSVISSTCTVFINFLFLILPWPYLRVFI